MSRYTKKLDNGKTIAWGFDHVTGYFLQVFEEEDVIDEEHPYLIINECSTFSKMSNGKMIELMDLYKLPESHIEYVAMDLPIE